MGLSQRYVQCPVGHAQNVTTLFGTLLRVDVDDGTPYAIPVDNPFAQSSGGERPEIYAWGFRNPWRWSFDRTTGRTWLGDVGQGAWEEVDVVSMGQDYGWSRREGAH
jgi:glucose/arabinose dehydrogenase